ncbi:MAG: hypothetical protein ABJ092_00725 [Gillisia sp.]
MKKLLFALFFMAVSFSFAGNDKPYLEIEETNISIPINNVLILQNFLGETLDLSESSACYFLCRTCITQQGIRYCSDWECCVPVEQED